MKLTAKHIPHASIMAIIMEPVDDTLSIEEHIANRVAAAINAWPGMEHLAATSINISGHDVAIDERINLPVVKP